MHLIVVDQTTQIFLVELVYEIGLWYSKDGSNVIQILFD